AGPNRARALIRGRYALEGTESMEAWIVFTVVAASVQAARTALQRQLKARLKTNSITFVRYFYGLPFALAYLAAVMGATGETPSDPDPVFLLYCLGAGVAQIVATSLLIQLFSYRNFAVGTTYSKTEVIQTALFGLVFFGAALSARAFAGILVSLAGVIVLSAVREKGGWRELLLGWTSRAAGIGLASGACFAFAALFIREAAHTLPEGGFLFRAAFVLAVMVVMQTVILGAYILWRTPGEYRLIVRSWRTSGLAGFLSLAGSALWAIALTLENAAHVRALGQVELILSLAISHLVFREHTRKTEILGMAVIAGGILLIVW
ncbi:MAG: EamA family transporter, partial [Alphaproteobacteria bacterium]